MNPNDALTQRETYTRQEGKLTDYETEVDPLLLNVADEDLLKEIKDRIDGSPLETSRLRNAQAWNEEYYYGDQLKRIGLMPWQVPAIENRIFLSIETLIPLVTANAGDPDIRTLLGAPDDPSVDQSNFSADDIAAYIDTLTATLMYDYNVAYRLKEKIRQIVRHWFMYRVGVGKYRFDPATNKIHFDVVQPRNIILPAKDQPQNWVAEYKEDTIADLLTLFPKAKKTISDLFWTGEGDIPDSILGTTIGYHEYWRDTFVAWRLNEQILDKKLNPNWDWDGETREVGKRTQILPTGVMIKSIRDSVQYNVLPNPRHPYFFFNYFRISGTQFDDTGYIEQARPVQDLINKRKRQIAAIADDSGLVIASGDGIKQEEFDKYDGSPRSKLWISSGNPNTTVARLPGGQVTQTMLNDLQDSREASDNIFGTQAVTRGQNQSGAESGVARQILHQADVTRVGPLAERVEDMLQEIYLYDIQMRMMFTDEDYVIPATSADTGEPTKSLVFNKYKTPLVKMAKKNMVDGKATTEEYFCPIPITLMVRRQSTLAKDPVSEYARDVDAFKNGLMDPKTLYEKTGEPNPDQKLERLFRWTHFPITMLSEKAQKDLMPLIMNPIPPPVERRDMLRLDFKDLPPSAQEGMLAQSGIIKGQEDAIKLEAELAQMKQQQAAQQAAELQAKQTPAAEPPPN
jgi:hypothetical protein